MNTTEHRTPGKSQTATLVGLVIAVIAASSSCGSNGHPTVSESDAAVLPSDAAKPDTPEPAIDLVKEKKDALLLLSNLLGDDDPRVRLGVLTFIRAARYTDWQDRLRHSLESEPDPEVRAWLAVTLGILATTEARPMIYDLYHSAEPVLKVWYDKALGLLHDKKAIKRLAKQARARDIEVALVAALALADLSRPGNKRTVELLRRLAGRESEFVGPFVAIEILYRLARLGYHNARQELHGLLEHDDEDLRLRAAEGLARIGDDTGKATLLTVFNNAGSRNRSLAGAILVDLGDYSAAALLRDCAARRFGDAEVRRRCIESLGTIGLREYLRDLRRLYRESDGTVRAAAAAAVLFIVGLDPRVLVQESVDWVRSALRSSNPAQRYDATMALVSLPPEKSIPLLTRVVSDGDPAVRRAAARTAGELKGLEVADRARAARTVEAALVVESVEKVKEEQVIALGKLGHPEVADTLRDISRGHNRLGTLAKGALIAVLGQSADPEVIEDKVEELERAFARGVKAIRLTVMEAAVLAANRLLVPVLERGLGDRLLDIRVAAAEGLAHYGISTDSVIAVLQDAARASRRIAARAVSALLRLNVPLARDRAVESLLDLPDAEVRRELVPAIAELPLARALSLAIELLEDPEPAVRRQSIDMVATVAERHPDAAIPLLKKARHNSDPITRIKAQAELAVLLKETATDPQPAEKKAAIDLRGMEEALERTRRAYAELEINTRGVVALSGEIVEHVANRASNEHDLDRAEKFRDRIEKAHAAVVAARGRVAEEAATFADAASEVRNRAQSLPDGDPIRIRLQELNQRAVQLEEQAGSHLRQSSQQTRERLEGIDKYLYDNEANPQLLLISAETAISEGRLFSASADLDRAERAYKRRNERDPQLDYVWGYYYDERAQRARQDKKRLRDLGYAKKHYDAFIKTGQGFRVERVRERVAEMAAELGEK
ncbi:MAG: HEAT repeat domain-containing protein [Proteobacteria bacterium]|nr:HEAT repeat domain-containing protein [Pseudomonadota bacterium]